MALNAKAVRGPIVGKRADLIEALAFAGDGLVAARGSTGRLENTNDMFGRTKAGAIEGRVAVTL